MTTDLPVLQQWTKRFTVASAGALIIYLFANLLHISHQTSVLICVFGFICPMIFGMGYLLIPPYVGRTLVDHRLPGIHFVLAYLGGGFLVIGWEFDGYSFLFDVGTILWVIGVAIFVSSLLVTVGPVIARNPMRVFQEGDKPQRTTKLATVAIPVAIGYLLTGTIVLLIASNLLTYGSASIPDVVHFYLVGFGMLLIIALGVRLLTGFFHVTPPRPLVWLALITGALASAFLGSSLWMQPWFRIGAILTGIAIGSYLLLVTGVVVRTEQTRPGLYGIFLGAVSGAVGVGSVIPIVFEIGQSHLINVHRTFILTGFFPLTIIGYAYLFFPVTDDGFSTPKIDNTTLTIGLLGIGVIIQAIGIIFRSLPIQWMGLSGSILGVSGYLWFMARRFFEVEHV